jgi:hypothetical protein
MYWSIEYYTKWNKNGFMSGLRSVTRHDFKRSKHIPRHLACALNRPKLQQVLNTHKVQKSSAEIAAGIHPLFV